MKQSILAKTLGLTIAASLILTRNLAAAPQHTKPNIIFIFADDLCFRSIHCVNNKEIKTPNLDKLVQRGTYFTHAYNQGGWHGAICVASRAMLNTGRFLWYAQKLDNPKAMAKAASENKLWAEYLHDAGYDTYMSGKWHVKINPEKVFDIVAHERPGMPNQTKEGYFRPVEGQPMKWHPWDKKYGGYWKGGRHWSEVLKDDALGFIDTASKKDKPFFMYLAFNAAHDPRQSPKEYVDMYPLDKVSLPQSFLPEYPWRKDIGLRNMRDENLAPFPRTPYSVKVNRQEYYAIITHMDHQIGLILDALEKSGKADNTYIFFTGDHGLSVGCHGLIGKQNLFDDSVRVPLLVCGPNIPKGKKIDSPAYLQDIMPTTLELAGVKKPPQVQFKSLLPLIDGRRKSNYNAVYGAYMNLQRMITVGKDKLILYPAIKKALLFDLHKDPLEMHDLSSNPEYRPLIKKLFHKLLQLQKHTGDKLDLTKIYPNLI